MDPEIYLQVKTFLFMPPSSLPFSQGMGAGLKGPGLTLGLASFWNGAFPHWAFCVLQTALQGLPQHGEGI